jgi:hypothetical protein
MFDFLCIQVTVMALALWSLKLVKKTQCIFGWWLQTGQGIEHCSLGVVACETGEENQCRFGWWLQTGLRIEHCSLGLVASETGEENPMQIRVVAANWSKN